MDNAPGSMAAVDGTRVDRSILLQNCRVPMRDGLTLATDVYLPAAGTGPWPVIVERTPYHRERTILVRAALYFSRHGYAFALQDVRGRYDSDGDWDFGLNEAEDGYDTVEWLASQPWSDGRVATTGLSYSNSTQSSLATLRPNSLVTQFRCQGQSSYYVSGLRMVGGALDGRMYPFMLHMALSDPRARADAQLTRRIEAHLEHDRLMPVLLRGTIDAGTTVLTEFPDYEASLLDTLTRGVYDDHWRNRTLSPQEYYSDVPDMPLMMVGSWYDMHTKGTLNDFVELGKRLTQPIHLVMGPWLHGEEPVRHSFSGQVEFGGPAAFDYNDERRRWFDHVLKGVDSGLDDEPPVKLFVMGGGSGRRRMDAPTPTHRLDHGGRWRWEHEWPLARMQATTFHVHAGGRLARDEPAGNGSVTYRYDPRNPVPSVGGAMSGVSSVAEPGGRDQRDPASGLPLDQRPDVLSFRSPPLDADTELTGPVTATLFVSSDAPDTDFTVKLIDEYPPSPDWPEGFALNICDGIIRARFREGFDREALLEPGEIYRLEVDLSATSNLFVRGHRIRVDISSSNFPKYDANPNTGEPLGRHRSWKPSNNTVHLSADHPSHVVLPVIPTS